MFTVKITFKSGNTLELSVTADTAANAEKIVTEYLKRKNFNPYNKIEII